ncbi:hypothetical protein HanPI659440_Chr09g0328751 [Helianthus annuus]|nr:hypothetical protein HanPI659440_Chr09g0328751 [Helianthus annuus]
MHRERASWEKYRELMSAEAKEFEHLKNKFQEDRSAFDKEKKSEEWGREGLRSKLQACEELLAKERKEWRVACENDNKKMFAACSKITNLEAEVISLKEKIEEAKSDRERAEVANSILNATELDKVVAALTDVVRAVGHRGGYLECTQHVEEALKQHFRTRHCSVTDQADEMLAKAEEVYDHQSLPVMELVMEALKHDDYVAQLKSILMVLETVELSDEEETTGGGGEE